MDVEHSSCDDKALWYIILECESCWGLRWVKHRTFSNINRHDNLPFFSVPWCFCNCYGFFLVFEIPNFCQINSTQLSFRLFVQGCAGFSCIWLTERAWARALSAKQWHMLLRPRWRLRQFSFLFQKKTCVFFNHATYSDWIQPFEACRLHH